MIYSLLAEKGEEAVASRYLLVEQQEKVQACTQEEEQVTKRSWDKAAQELGEVNAEDILVVQLAGSLGVQVSVHLEAHYLAAEVTVTPLAVDRASGRNTGRSTDRWQAVDTVDNLP